MRVLIYSNNELNRLKVQDELPVLIDYSNDYDEVEYLASIRYYDLIILELEKDRDFRFLELFKRAFLKNEHSKILIYNANILTDGTKNLYNKYNIDSYIQEKVSISNLEKLIREESKITIDSIKVIDFNMKENEITINIRKTEHTLKFFKSLDFYVFLYFLRNYKETINLSKIIDATVEEPELIRASLGEASIASIRRKFKKILGINPIKSFKKVGYRFAI